MAFTNLQRRKLRSWLTMLGIFIGIATIVSLISLGEGLQSTVMSQFSNIGPDVINILASQYGPTSTSANPFTSKELEAVRRIRGVDLVAARTVSTARVRFRDISTGVQVSGVPKGEYGRNLFEIVNYNIERGRFIEDSDRYSIVLGNGIATSSRFHREIRTGDKVTINGIEFDVVGILESTGSFAFDGTAFVPERAYSEIFDVPEGEYMIIGAKIIENADIQEVISDIEQDLRRVRDVREENQNFQVQAALDTVEQVQSALSAVQIFLYIIASISIVVGAIGIMNTMYTSVLERTREIGIMKAIGAKNISIFYIFLIESGLLGMVGGIIGVLLGYGLGKTAEYIGRTFLDTGLITAQFSIILIVGSLLFSFILGSASGLFPAMQASKLHPVDALNKTK
ncbi:MAG: ABC transporter permease [Nanoarchaeota archaeon]